MNKDRLFMSCLGMIIGIILGVVAGQCIAAKKYIKCIEAYDAYNKATEELLDTLNNEYDWVDTFDPQEYYDSKEKLDSLVH